ncbi:cyclin-T1-3 isoform X1 [Amborella trichopoda]|uniref:cyclin-T1-3 isoform X1 n=3 Tax=Amborella trichopoda TaxID=13333 RepID=UPI0009BD69B7|nr:cyclin-T1-3 isoform X1 [Amborella trichopoda]XP_020523966.1 cyclin-T1-3 isoform X1 [Amborella trichopoda]XP_020523967.1 cyclin-T1-3 isoform X1 [Amborella trichopoda]XP_020523968.1 cyclin-T1-3 isoform X1 [Amborella trichopoda]XP_020523969.1 cyclin-T1-3 isoform X1 [Amborella trichopoda]XP_020523970.1 cyclin-T1-3 isoform X1 [Amborella trichopoda]|eukprot:XP_020523965.1 cyclin-T1-3 isoform X1 [Amborella trichopoda]
MHYLDLDILLNLDKMAGLLSGDPSHQEMLESGSYSSSRDNLVEPDNSSFNWFFTRNEIEENSPSRRDGIDLKKENKFRTSYGTFIQDLGMRLEVPQATIATAIIFCHRFFLHQSHAKNDRWTIAIACMFLAGKVEGTPRSLWNVILISYELRYRKAVQGHNQRILVFKQQRELILLGERVVLSTLGFDLIVHHPYKPLIKAIKNFKVEKKKALLQAAWNFVNDGLRTSLFLQFKSHHIAAGAIFLAAKFVQVELPTDGEVVWWQEFDVTPRQLIGLFFHAMSIFKEKGEVMPVFILSLLLRFLFLLLRFKMERCQKIDMIVTRYFGKAINMKNGYRKSDALSRPLL